MNIPKSQMMSVLEKLTNIEKFTDRIESSLINNTIEKKKQDINYEKLKGLIDKKISLFYKNKINEKDIKLKLKEYNKISDNLYKDIENLEDQRFKLAFNFIKNKVISNTLNKNNKPLFLFVPHFEQSIYNEYDIDIKFSRNLLSKEEQIEYATIVFNIDFEISKKYYELATFYENNKSIEYYEELMTLYNSIYNKKDTLYDGTLYNYSQNSKIVINTVNHYWLYKDDIFLYKLSLNNPKKFEDKKNSLIKNYFRKNKYNEGYFNLRWIVLDTYYKEMSNNDDFNIDIHTFFKNSNNVYKIEDGDIIIKENCRKDLDIIKVALEKYLESQGLSNIINNAYIGHYLLDENNNNRTPETIKIKDTI